MIMQAEDVITGRVLETVQVGPLDSSLPILPDIAASPSTMKGLPTFTAGWWVYRLMKRLDERLDRIQTWDEYYRGNQPLAFASERFREAFGGRFKAFSSNFMALVVDGTRERMEVTGFEFSSQRSSKRAWRIWQENDMDSLSQMAHTEALIKGIAYALVEPQRFDTPRITIELPEDAITESDPRDRRRRLAGLKRWVDESGHLVVYLYEPHLVWKLRSESKWRRGGTYKLLPFPSSDDNAWPMRNPMGVVPLVPLVNRPRLGDDGQSEIDAVMSNQDAVNKYRADALVAAEFAAFRQRWAIGLDVPVDPTTGLPVEPFKAAVDRLWIVPPPDPDDPNPQSVTMGEFEATDLAPYQSMIESEVGAISSISRLPYHYLLGQPQAVPPSGESLKSSEAGLIAKVLTQMIHFGEGWEETARLTLLASGDAGASDRASETSWKDPETRNDGVRADAATKLYMAAIIERDEARASLGYPPGVVAPTPSEPQPPDESTNDGPPAVDNQD